VKSELLFNGADGSTTFTDTQGAIWTPAGGASISTAQSVSGGSSAYFSGSGALISTPDASDNSFLNFATDNYRVELAAYPLSLGAYTALFAKRATGGAGAAIQVGIRSGKLFIAVWSGSWYEASSAVSLPSSAWSEIKVERIGTSLKGYLAGVEIVSKTIPATISFAPGSPLSIGACGDGSEPFHGYIDNFVLTKL
jgi:hypothetical protein